MLMKSINHQDVSNGTHPSFKFKRPFCIETLYSVFVRKFDNENTTSSNTNTHGSLAPCYILQLLSLYSKTFKVLQSTV